jgi:molybdopterin-guanine dinucleotide biosynthesis protein A
MTRAKLTGILLVGGASSRFGAPKALARLGSESLAERAWRTLGEACEHRLAVGKGDENLPFPIVRDRTAERAPIHGLATGLRAAPTEVSVVLPVDCPLITSEALLALAAACRDAAVPQTGPLPGAYRKSTLSALEAGELSIRRALEGLDVVTVELNPALLVNVNTPDELEALQLTHAGEICDRPRCYLHVD